MTSVTKLVCMHCLKSTSKREGKRQDDGQWVCHACGRTRGTADPTKIHEQPAQAKKPAVIAKPNYATMDQFDDFNDLSNVTPKVDPDTAVVEVSAQTPAPPAVASVVHEEPEDRDVVVYPAPANPAPVVLAPFELIGVDDDIEVDADDHGIEIHEKELTPPAEQARSSATGDTSVLEVPSSAELQDFNSDMGDYESADAKVGDSARTEIVDLKTDQVVGVQASGGGVAENEETIFRSEEFEHEEPLRTEVVDLAVELGDDEPPVNHGADRGKEDDLDQYTSPSLLNVMHSIAREDHARIRQLDTPTTRVSDMASTIDEPQPEPAMAMAAAPAPAVAQKAAGPVLRLKATDCVEFYRTLPPLPQDTINRLRLQTNSRGVIILSESDIPKKKPAPVLADAEAVGAETKPVEPAPVKEIAKPKKDHFNEENVFKYSLYASIIILSLLPFTFYFKWSWTTVEPANYEKLKNDSSFFDRTFDIPFRYRTPDSWFRWYGRRVLIPQSYKDAKAKYGMFTWLLYVESPEESWGDDLLYDQK